MSDDKFSTDDCYIATMLSILIDEFGELSEREKSLVKKILETYVKKLTEY